MLHAGPRTNDAIIPATSWSSRPLGRRLDPGLQRQLRHRPYFGDHALQGQSLCSAQRLATASAGVHSS